ncbi:helix-turn-helix domain-containing protein [Streptomyces sp. O3]
MTSDRRGGQASASDLAEELRRLRKLNGLTLAVLARRTNYSKSSWERYLNGKVIPPESAVLAFARTVGVRPERLVILRNLAEERVPDVVAEAAGGGGETAADSSRAAAGGAPAQDGVAAAPPDDGTPATPEAGTAPNMMETAPRGTSGQPLRRGLVLAGVAALSAVLGLAAGIPLGLDRSGADRDGAGGGAGASTAAMSQQSAVGSGHAGPGCVEFECREKDPQRLNCHIGVWTAAAVEKAGAYLELRYSPACRAAWARITEADVGDIARVESKKGTTQERAISYDGDTYSPMVEAPYPAAARACAELTSGQEFCTGDGGPSPLPEASTDESEPG